MFGRAVRVTGRAGAVGLLLCAAALGPMPRAATGPSAGQAQIGGQPQPGQRGEAPLHAVVNFLELAERERKSPPKLERKPIPFMRMPPRRPPPAGARPAPTIIQQPAAAPPTVLAPSPPLALNFEALADNECCIPPGTMGAAGPNHLMVTLNSQVRIQNKSDGGVVSTVSLDSFWSSTGATGCFDPKLTYDPYGNRWIFIALSNAKSANSSLLVGVSKTTDPTGDWNLYRIDVDATDTDWADYPSVGFNKDWVVVNVNMYDVEFSTWSTTKIYVFTKSALYAGDTASYRIFTDDLGATEAPAVTYSDSFATVYLVENWNGDSDGGWLRISTITGAVGSEVYTAGTAYPTTASTWAEEPALGADSNFAPQLGSTDKIQNGDSRVRSVVYRNGSLWVAQNVFLPAGLSPNRTAVQWWHITPTGTVQQFGRVQDSSVFYAYPSIAVNAYNDALLGYSTFSSGQYASAGYSFRASSDPLNVMRSSSLLKAGAAAYYKTSSGTNRWGDYSSTVVDPANDMDFWTIQEYAGASNHWGTWWGKMVAPAPKKRRGQVTSQ